jgi:DNA-binding LytR/AlgR family response regulator
MKEKFRVMLIDDEQVAIDYLVSLLTAHHPDFEVTGFATSSAEALEKYPRFLPELLFLDVQIDARSGFDVLSEIYRKGKNPYVIFVTAYDKYAVEAFRQNALDYLLKPVNPVDLKRAVQKFVITREKDEPYRSIRNFMEQERKKIRFNVREGFILFSPDEIFYCEASQNYTMIFTITGHSEIISTNLGKIEEILTTPGFWRISKSHIVNTKYITKVDRRRRECILSNGDTKMHLPLAKERLREMPF